MPREDEARARPSGFRILQGGLTSDAFRKLDPEVGDEYALATDDGPWIRAAVPAISEISPEAPILLLAAPFYGEFLRDPQPIHWAGLAFQAICVASLGFLVWFWLLTIYRASAVASFSFLSPVLAVLFGWLILGERIGPAVFVALVLVAAGIFLINRR